MQLAKSLLTFVLLGTAFWFFGREIVNHRISEQLPIRYVRTEGVFQYLSKDEVKTALMPQVMKNIFEADMQGIHDSVEKLPWVKHVNVERVWPDAIDISVQERKAFVRWGKDGLLTESGELFTPTNVAQFGALLLVEGPKDQEAKTLEIMKGVKLALDDKALDLAEFSVNDRAAWKIKLATGLEILLGNTEQLKKLQRFLNTLHILGQQKLAAMQIIDLRYPNGFAVTWKPETEALMKWDLPKPLE